MLRVGTGCMVIGMASRMPGLAVVVMIVVVPVELCRHTSLLVLVDLSLSLMMGHCMRRSCSFGSGTAAVLDRMACACACAFLAAKLSFAQRASSLVVVGVDSDWPF